MRCDIFRGTDLARTVWSFYLNADFSKAEIRCERYTIENRPTKHHNWVVSAQWDRTNTRENTLELNIPSDVAEEARSDFSYVVSRLEVH